MPKLKNNCLSTEDAARMRGKIEAIFAIALHKGHDSLLLSALGCGACQNPPNHIAGKCHPIVITTTNPASNYEIFSYYLDRAILRPGISILRPVIAPTVETYSFRGWCNKDDTTHTEEFYHPPFCGKDCKSTAWSCGAILSPILLRKWRWMPFDGRCTSPAVSPCSGVRKRHFLSQQGGKAAKIQCQDGGFCGRYMVMAHMEQYVHPFNTPCRDTPFACTNMDANHVANFAHVCKYGATCPHLLDLHHAKNLILVVRIPCPDDNKCILHLDEEHLAWFSHPEIADIRITYTFGQECNKRNQPSHIADYTRPSEGPLISSYDDSGQDINFSGNAEKIIKATDAYFGKKKKEKF
ncbi:hypothetical protein BC938DRAFT_475566 [Jimgerdemannia flammicorona]|uniref:Uncharacterized protein n=1 Tax=Jimgerdemannia flammicorona TaxID=994334 RepID=A0A433PSE2_9FUNG|nr:hypothetical protein BC938DRAFT_475566 [Jimgerdemannia flammicorona]